MQPYALPRSPLCAPRKRWGQHFLRDQRYARQIVQLLRATPGDTVLEIGPGTGALTQHLLELPVRLIAVELDDRCVDFLRRRFPPTTFPQAEFIQGDILKYDLAETARQALELSGRKLLVIGNLPYNISSPVLFQLFALAPLLARAVVMLQREVARRLVAVPRTKEYGILSVACWVVAKAQLCFHVSPAAFIPPPKVVSSVVTLEFRAAPLTGPAYEAFLNFLHAAFGQRRKQLKNALSEYVASRSSRLSVEELLHRAGISPSSRAEELSPEQLVHLYSTIAAEAHGVGEVL
ncbi:MAG: 16S rRNA (adenine(1518)-N(6)/adenine(1519)-N(6))-dimethyltransferase RsmA [Candidatus Kapabacteria bacterium]|nr:16S rRNA (adenine(1518)-N(6)/adenine(1519)-N(6))-dimethyltransferase RsmA [Candidatus Kapabacteria bacterium]